MSVKTSIGRLGRNGEAGGKGGGISVETGEGGSG